MAIANLEHLSSAKVLIVEDDPILRTMLNNLVAPHVASVTVACDGADGLEKWRASQPDVVLTDIDMPVMDGLEMSSAIKANEPDCPIIVISSSHETEDLRRAIDIGVERYVFKPIDHKLLLDAIAKSMQERHYLMELQMAKMVFEVAAEGIMVTDATPKILACNPALSEITGYRPDELIGQKTSMLSSGLHNPDFYRAMWDSIKTHGRWSGEIYNRRKDGDVFAEWLSIATVRGGSRATQRYVGIVSDITERKRQEEHIRRLAHFDSLTGLPNRVLFNDRLQRAIFEARRNGYSVAVLYIDLDHFKEINDCYGHAVGDEVLKAVSQRMQECIRQSDTVSRRGGDEFVILLETRERPDGAAIVCQKLLDAFAEPLDIGGQQLNVGASIGAAVFPADADDGETLLTAADFALYEAKTEGRGQFRFFQAEAQSSAWQRLDMEYELREGLKDWRFSMHYLPEISLRSGQVENIEALLRFQHPVHGLLDAGRFLEVAEDIGIMPELGQRALKEAACEMSELSAQHGRIGLVVDLSTRQLLAADAVDRLLETLSGGGLPTENVTFECPEGAFSENSSAMQTIFRLAASGCKFTLDDFGAGYCSFSMLRQLPMSSIKIDRSFVGEIDRSPQSRELVAALIAFGKRLGLRTVAEGVETASQLAFLQESGCDSVQGFLFGRPMDRKALGAFLHDRPWLRLIAAN